MKGITAAQAREIMTDREDLLHRIEISIAREATYKKTEMSWNMGNPKDYTDIVHILKGRGFTVTTGVGMLFPFFTVSWAEAQEVQDGTD